MKHEITPIASFGDLVTVNGYGDHLFAVDSYDICYTYEPDYELTELVYDLTCVYGDSGYIIGEQADVTVMCTEAESEAYLREYKPQAPKKLGHLTVNLSITDGGVVAVNKPKPKKPSKQTEIDALLDELTDLLTLHAVFGGKDLVYAEKIARVTGKLKEVSGG